jgi:pSer/pThr/pTyr-binding forkhead associated (FHA) protein
VVAASAGAARATVRLPRDADTTVGVLVFDDGSSFDLDGDYVVGREPEFDARVVDDGARPLELDDPDGAISRVHAEVRLVDGRVELLDRGSTNGTQVWNEQLQVFDRLVAGEPRVLQPGDRASLGSFSFVYELRTVPNDDAPPPPPPG